MPTTSSIVTSISLGSYRTCGDFPADIIGTIITTPSSAIRPSGRTMFICPGGSAVKAERKHDIHRPGGERREAEPHRVRAGDPVVAVDPERREPDEELPQ